MSNSYVVNILNPYNHYGHEAYLELVYQEMANFDNPYKFTFDMFLDFCPEFDTEVMTIEGSIAKKVYERYSKIAHGNLSYWTFFGEWDYLMAMYIAHYLQLTINRMKNDANKTAYVKRNQPTSQQGSIGGEEIKVIFASAQSANHDDFFRTEYGKQFYDKFRKYAKYEVMGVY
jgi:hypothetical protein